MSKSEKKTPELRFKGFTQDWEQRQLGELAERVTRKNKNLESTLPLTISAAHGLVDQETFFNKKVASKDVSGYYLVKNGEFAYNKSYSNGYPWGAVKRLDKYKMGVLSTLYIVFKLNEKLNSDFIVTYYETNNWHKEVSIRAAEGARNHGLLNITATDFFETELIISTETEEQQKIGEFFRDFDHLITLHQRKYDALSQLKKAYLQTLFPSYGESVPKLRFTDFNGIWKQRELSYLAEIITGGTPKTSVLEYWEPKEIPWMSSGEVNKRRLNETDNMISEKGLNNSSAKWIKEHSVLIALAGQGKTRGTVAVNNIPLTTNQSIAAIIPNKDLYYEFLFQNLIKRYDELRMISSGDGTRGGLNKRIVSEVIVPFININEQEKIGEFLSQLDNLIALHLQKIAKLQDLKKSYLQKLFV